MATVFQTRTARIQERLLSSAKQKRKLRADAEYNAIDDDGREVPTGEVLVDALAYRTIRERVEEFTRLGIERRLNYDEDFEDVVDARDIRNIDPKHYAMDDSLDDLPPCDRDWETRSRIVR